MKNFSFRIFIVASIIMGVGLILSYLIAFGVDDKWPDVGIFWVILSKAFIIFSFPIVELYWLFGTWQSDIYLWEWILNCLLNGLIIERFFYWRRKKSKIPSVRTRI
jgi:hypothetical protein